MLHVVAPEVFSSGLRDATIKALAYIGTEEELEDFRHEAIDNWATKASLDKVKISVQFHGISKAIKIYTDNFGAFSLDSEFNDDKFWRLLFFMIINEALEIKELKKPASKQPKDWEVDVPEEEVGNILKMFQTMATGGAKVFINKDFQ